MGTRYRPGDLFRVADEEEKSPRPPGGQRPAAPSPEDLGQMTPAEKGRAVMLAMGWKWDARGRRWVR